MQRPCSNQSKLSQANLRLLFFINQLHQKNNIEKKKMVQKINGQGHLV